MAHEPNFEPSLGSIHLYFVGSKTLALFLKSQKIDARLVPNDKRQTQILGRQLLFAQKLGIEMTSPILVIRKKKPPQVVEKSPRTNKPIIYMHLRAQYYYCCRSLTFAALYYTHIAH